MATNLGTARPSALEQNWWLRAPAVLVAPRAVFASLRDDSEDAVDARQEQLTAMIGMAGIAAVLASPTFRRILNDAEVSLVLVPVLAFVAGAVYAVAVYWVGGALLHGASRRLGGLGDFRRARHVIALASTPIALTLVTLWPLRIGIYGEDLFRTGGNDWGPGDRIFGALIFAAVAWSVLLLVEGVRAVHGWSWARSAAAVALAAALPTLIVLAAAL